MKKILMKKIRANLASHLKTVETFFDLYLEDITASQKGIVKGYDN